MAGTAEEGEFPFVVATNMVAQPSHIRVWPLEDLYFHDGNGVIEVFSEGNSSFYAAIDFALISVHLATKSIGEQIQHEMPKLW
jgi:hypothetical protein